MDLHNSVWDTLPKQVLVNHQSIVYCFRISPYTLYSCSLSTCLRILVVQPMATCSLCWNKTLTLVHRPDIWSCSSGDKKHCLLCAQEC